MTKKEIKPIDWATYNDELQSLLYNMIFIGTQAAQMRQDYLDGRIIGIENMLDKMVTVGTLARVMRDTLSHQSRATDEEYKTAFELLYNTVKHPGA